MSIISGEISHRDMTDICKWFRKDRTNSSSVIYSKKPSGEFWSKEMSAYQTADYRLDTNIVSTQKTITLMTRDDISDMQRNDKVLYEENYWLVGTVQKTEVHSRAYMTKDKLYITYITLTR